MFQTFTSKPATTPLILGCGITHQPRSLQGTGEGDDPRPTHALREGPGPKVHRATTLRSGPYLPYWSAHGLYSDDDFVLTLALPDAVVSCSGWSRGGDACRTSSGPDRHATGAGPSESSAERSSRAGCCCLASSHTNSGAQESKPHRHSAIWSPSSTNSSKAPPLSISRRRPQEPSPPRHRRAHQPARQPLCWSHRTQHMPRALPSPSCAYPPSASSGPSWRASTRPTSRRAQDTFPKLRCRANWATPPSPATAPHTARPSTTWMTSRQATASRSTHCRDDSSTKSATSSSSARRNTRKSSPPPTRMRPH